MNDQLIIRFPSLTGAPTIPTVMYTIATSKPQVEAITWWNLSDRRTFWPHGGLLDVDQQPKPAYHRLLAFIRGLSAG